MSRRSSSTEVSCEVVLQLADRPFDVAPGLWDTGGLEGLVFVANTGGVDVSIEGGDPVAQVALASVQTRLCSICGAEDTDAWELSEGDESCKECGVVQGAGPALCRMCGAAAKDVGCLSYAGCAACRPEIKDGDRWKRPDGESATASSSGALPVPVQKVSAETPRRYPKGMNAMGRLCALICAVQVMKGDSSPGQPVRISKNPIYHIVEEPGGIDRMTAVEVPPEAYYVALRADMVARHPNASSFVLDHLLSVEAFFDVSICAGFSFGCAKAQLLTPEAFSVLFSFLMVY